MCIVDFGIACQLSTEGNAARGTCGSAYWMAPEVMRRELYTTAADIWSLGMVLLEMCNSEPYLYRKPVAALISAALDDFLLPDVDEPGEWPDALLLFLRRCLK